MEEQNQQTQQNPNSEQEKKDAYLAKKERKALKREKKLLERISRDKNKKMKKFFFRGAMIAVVVVIIGLIAWLIMESWEPLGPDFSQAMPDEGAPHFSEGTPIEYESNPPTSGPHWPIPLADGIYDTEKPDEAVVHSLEHGRIWVSYHPLIPQEIIEQLENLLRRQGAVILTPREANEMDIALAAWNRLDIFNLDENGNFDEKRILDFIRRYRLKGPEFVPMEAGGGKTYDDFSYIDIDNNDVNSNENQ